MKLEAVYLELTDRVVLTGAGKGVMLKHQEAMRPEMQDGT